MPASGDQPAGKPVEIVSITAADESDAGQLQLDVQLANFPRIQGDRGSKSLHSHLTHRIMQALDLQVITRARRVSYTCTFPVPDSRTLSGPFAEP